MPMLFLAADASDAVATSSRSRSIALLGAATSPTGSSVRSTAPVLTLTICACSQSVSPRREYDLPPRVQRAFPVRWRSDRWWPAFADGRRRQLHRLRWRRP
jgi:hypothetical protein